MQQSHRFNLSCRKNAAANLPADKIFYLRMIFTFKQFFLYQRFVDLPTGLAPEFLPIGNVLT